jgi:uncharacterized membrane protein
MKKYSLLLASLAVTLTISLAGCGGGGGGGNSDKDGDGIPNAQDAFPNDATKFASFAKVDLLALQGSTFSSAVAINDTNMIVGAANDVQGDTHPVLWKVTGTTATPADRLEITSNFGAAYDLNNGGDTVGEEANATAGRNAVIWLATAGTPTGASPLVLTPVVGAQFSAAYGINNARRIVGESQSASVTKAVTWTLAGAGAAATPSQPNMLGEPAGGTASSAYFIGEDNRIVGEYTVNGTPHGILWNLSADGATTASMIDLPPLAGDAESVAYGINADGRIVGESTSAAGVVRGVTWTLAGTVATPAALGTTGEGNALAINDSGRLAGWTAPAAGGLAMASVLDVRNLALFDSVLAATGFSQSFGINNAGSIVGMAGGAAFAAVPQ